MDGKLVHVAVGRPVEGPFTYRLPPGLDCGLRPGQRVAVPFGAARALGIYLGEAPEAPTSGRLRDVERVLDPEPVFTPDLLALLRWMAAYYRYPLGEVLRSALPPGLAQPLPAPPDRPLTREWVSLTDAGRIAPRPRGAVMQAVLDYLAAAPGEVDREELLSAFPNGREPLARLVQQGLCVVRSQHVERDRPELALAGAPVPSPTREQAAVLEVLEAAVGAGGFKPFLLHGVTGSGKTEVYLRAIARAVEAGRGALVLVPEIALTPQLVGRFRNRFGETVAVLHSGLRDAERLADWRRLRSGAAPIAVGVRSAVFAPVANLGIVIVDEEHDGSFKQEDKLRYNARDVAVMRAREAGCPVVLGSATPSLESLHNARCGRYGLLELRSRVDDRPMPEVTLVDMRLLPSGHGHVSAAFPQLAAKAKMRAAEQEKLERMRQSVAAVQAGDCRGGAEHARDPAPSVAAEEEGPGGPPLLSRELSDALVEVLARGRQAILFLNRRGHSTYHVCLECGQSILCENCAVSLTMHKDGWLRCHYCGQRQRLPEICPTCGGHIESLGMGTERVEQEIAAAFPAARVCRLDRDAVTQADEVTAVLTAFARGQKDVLIGTQMVAKGHDFPGVTLVGVLLADLALNLPDFRAAERTFQLLAQVGGRAGRGEEPGRVLVQTFNPEAPAIAATVGHDFAKFSEHELMVRKAYHYPPFCRLLAARIDGPHPQATADAARAVALAASRVVRASGGDLRMLGPAPAPISRLKGRSRWQLLFKGPSARSLVAVAEAVEAAGRELPSNVRVGVDVDPLAML